MEKEGGMMENLPLPNGHPAAWLRLNAPFFVFATSLQLII